MEVGRMDEHVQDGNVVVEGGDHEYLFQAINDGL